MAAHRMRPLPPVDLADPAAVAAWVATVRGHVDMMRPLVTDATTRAVHRRHGRRYLRSRLCRALRDVEVMLDAIAPAPPVPDDGAEHGDPSGNGGSPAL